MAWDITASINVNWVPEGAGAQSVPSGQTENLTIGAGAAAQFLPVAVSVTTNGTLTASNMNAACTTLGSLCASYFGTTTLGTLQAWSTGGN